MPSFRFCRPDDIPLLVQAVNRCFVPHFNHLEPLTIDEFQREVRELDIWPSNCMVAAEGSDPVGVLIAGKREKEVLIHRVGLREDRMRQGFGSHMVTSLGQKLAVLGPPRLVAEVPADNERGQSFFDACGYRSEGRLLDWESTAPLLPLTETSAIFPLQVDEALEHDLIQDSLGLSWMRCRETVLDRKDSLKGLAVASPDRIEAFVFYLHDQHGVEVWRFGAADPEALGVWLPLLLRAVENPSGGPLRVPLLSAAEVDFDLLSEMGFRPSATTVLWVGQAKAL